MIKRREFIALLGGAAVACPATAQHSGMPVIGFLNAASADLFGDRLRALREGLKETGFVEGENVAIEYRWAEGQYKRLPALATELVHRRVDVIVSTGGPVTALAAKAATTTTPHRLHHSRRPGQARPCRESRPTRRQRDRSQFFQRGVVRKAA